MMKDGMNMGVVSKKTRLVQIEIPVSVKEKLDEIFTKDWWTKFRRCFSKAVGDLIWYLIVSCFPKLK